MKPLQIREFSKDEVRARSEKRQKRANKLPTVNIAAVKIPRNRPKHKYRYCVSLTPATAYFIREQFGGPEQSLSHGIETAAKMLRTAAKERK